MWSLFQKKTGGDSILYNYEHESLEPLIFSNGKTQEDVVKEILLAIDEGNKIILIKGVCGTGKSAISLNLARHFKKTSIAVPIKSLQEQYEEDYTNKKFILKKDNKNLKISVIKGRNNFQCPFMNTNADSLDLPCTIELREKNFEKLMNFVEINKYSSKKDFLNIGDVKRMSVAPACPYWSPLLPAKSNSACLEKAEKKEFKTVSGKDYAIFQRQKGCKYYDQYQNYIDADVLIFNSKKYLIETLIGRRPKTDIDVIDECDEFLDNLAEEKQINLNRLATALKNISAKDIEEKTKIKEIIFMIDELIYNFSLNGIEKLENTEVFRLIKEIIENPYLAENEERNYYNSVVESCYEFKDLLNETYISFNKVKSFAKINEEKEICYVNLVTINLAKKFKDVLDKTNVLIMMSGTLHSEDVLKNIYGIKDFKIIEAETKMPGKIIKQGTGYEKNFKYENFRNGKVTRRDYLIALGKCLDISKKPVLIHVNSFADLPSEIEKQELGLDNLITKEELMNMQRENNNINRFKNKEIDILFTTKCSRGIDFPGEQCNSIIITKYPYPSIKSLFWMVLKRENPNNFMKFYMDKARRELLQKVYRGVRSSEDEVILLSPDSRVLDAKI
jgi:Rad3-related DNA helicase